MSAPGSGDDFHFTGVVLEALTDGTISTVNDLSVSVGESGITIETPGPLPPSRIEWNQVADARCTDPAILPNGERATALTMAVVGRQTRLLIPDSQITPVMAGQLNLMLMGYTGSAIVSQTLPESVATPSPVLEPHDLPVVEDVPFQTMTPLGDTPPLPPPPPPLASVPAPPPLQPVTAPAPPPQRPRSPAHAAPEPAPTLPPPPITVPPPPISPLPASTLPTRPITVPPPPISPLPASTPLENLPPPPVGAVPLAPGTTAFVPDNPAPIGAAPYGAVPPGPPIYVPLAAMAAANQDPTLAYAPPPGQPGASAPPAYAAYAPAPYPPPLVPVQKKRSRGLLYAVVGLVVLLVAAAVAIPLTLGHHHTATPPSTTQRERQRQAALGTAAQQVGRQVNIALGDLPPAPPWSIDSSDQAALNAFLSTNNDDATPSAAEQKEDKVVATQFEACMGIAAGADRVFGDAVSIPTTTVDSPIFAEASPSKSETGSETEVFANTTSVKADAAQISSPKFPNCLGAALGSLLSDAFGAGPVTTGTPVVQPIAITAVYGTNPVGANITIPLTENGVTTNIEYGFVLVMQGKVEATLLTFNTPTPFSTVLQLQLIQTLAKNISTVGLSTGA